jgi:hypothetical protein
MVPSLYLSAFFGVLMPVEESVSYVSAFTPGICPLKQSGFIPIVGSPVLAIDRFYLLPDEPLGADQGDTQYSGSERPQGFV